MTLAKYDIEPVSAPRMVQSDRWKKRPVVLRYFAYKDEVRLKRVQLYESGSHITFVLPMPKSWSKKKKASMLGMPHQQKPDWDRKGISMKQYGLIKENGKIKSFKMPEHDVHKQQLAERELKQKLTKEQMKFAENALDEWGFWLFENCGYGDSSCNISDRDRLPALSHPPFGVEMSVRVANVINTLSFMRELDSKHQEYVYFIYAVLGNRTTNETYKHLFGRLDFGFTYKQFVNARKRFAQLYTRRTVEREYY